MAPIRIHESGLKPLPQTGIGPEGPPACISDVEMVGLGRFELPTSPLSGVRSNQLSYRPGVHEAPGLSRARSDSSPGLLPIQSGNLYGSSRLPLRLRFTLKGGDPAARSRTATLLRLHPSHWPHRGKRPPEG